MKAFIEDLTMVVAIGLVIYFVYMLEYRVSL